MKRVKIRLIILGLLVMLAGYFVVLPVSAAETTNVCDRYETAWVSRQSAYERAKKIRMGAFAQTQERWKTLFSRLESSGISVTTLRTDAGDVAVKFDLLIAADDAQIAAVGDYGRASCANNGASDARKALRAAQEGRRTARQAFVESLRQLFSDLANIRSQLKEN